MLECPIYDGNRILLFPECFTIHHFQELHKCIRVWPTTWSNCNSRNYGPDKCLSGSDIKDKTKIGLLSCLHEISQANQLEMTMEELEVLESFTEFFC